MVAMINLHYIPEKWACERDTDGRQTVEYIQYRFMCGLGGVVYEIFGIIICLAIAVYIKSYKLVSQNFWSTKMTGYFSFFVYAFAPLYTIATLGVNHKL